MSLVLFLTPALAQDAVAPELSLSYRPRLEAHTGKDGVAGAGNVLALSHRARLGVTLERPELALHLQIQDVRTWGEEAHTLKDYTADGLDVHQAWVRWSPADVLTLKAGRQEVSLHEQRLVGAVGWTQQARSFDGALLSGGGEAWDLDLGAFLLHEGDLVEEPGDAALALARAGWKSDTARVDALAMLEHDGRTDFDRVTVGAYAKGAHGPWTGRIEAYGQAGSSGDAAIRAAMVGVEGTWSPELAAEPRLTLWADWLSADTDPDDTVQRAFAAPYATNHKFYGFADITAFSQGAWADGAGLVDLALRGSVSAPDGTRLFLDAHTFVTPGAGMLAEEIDLYAKRGLGEGLSLWAGGALWLPAREGTPDLWGVVQLQAAL